MTDLDRIRAEARIAEAAELRELLAAAGGNVAQTARLLSAKRRERNGLYAKPCSRAQVLRLMDRHGISRPRKA